jgi:hypothetical protein
MNKYVVPSIIGLILLSLNLVSAWVDNGAATQNVDGCNIINTTNAVYTLTADISSSNTNCLTINANNITLKGANHNISVTGGGTAAAIKVGIGAYANNSFSNINITTSGDNLYGMYLNGGCTSCSFTNLSIITNGMYSYGIRLLNSQNNSFSNINITTSGLGANGVEEGSKNNLWYSSWINAKWGIGIYLEDNSAGSEQFINVYSNGSNAIFEHGSNTNSFIVNNSYGEIRWISNSFLMNLTTINNITTNSIVIQNNLAYLNSTYFKGENINSSANITLRGLSTTFNNPQILKDGVICTDCYNFTSLNAGTVIFNVSSWSNYTIAGNITSLVTLLSPNNATYSSSNKTFSINVTDQINLANVTLYIWNASNNAIWNKTVTSSLTGVSNSTSWNITFNSSGTFLWNVLVYNNGSYPSWASSNNTLYVDITNPVITQYFPTSNQYLNYNNINLTCIMSGDNLNSGFLYGNFSGTYILNSTNLSIIQNANTIFSLNLLDGSYIYSCAVNKTSASTLYFSQYGNYTFTIDTISPLLSITSPTGTLSSKTFLMQVNATDNVGLQTCSYNITRGASLEVSNTVFSNCANASTSVSSDGDYVLNVLISDLAGNKNFSNQTFSVNTVVIPPSGGGGGGTTIINGQTKWTMATDSNTASYILEMSAKTQRTKAIVFYNKGTTAINLNLKVIGNASSFITLDSDTLTLPLLADIPTQTNFKVTIPDGTAYGTYQANIIATDQNGNNGLITVIVQVGSLGTFNKLTASKEVTPTFFIPYWIISLVFGVLLGTIVYFISKNSIPDLAMSIAIFVGFLGGIGILFLV